MRHDACLLTRLHVLPGFLETIGGSEGGWIRQQVRHHQHVILLEVDGMQCDQLKMPGGKRPQNGTLFTRTVPQDIANKTKVARGVLHEEIGDDSTREQLEAWNEDNKICGGMGRGEEERDNTRREMGVPASGNCCNTS